MACKVYFRRFVALLLCCVLVGSSFPFQASATDPVTAASLAITGGQLAGAGLSGEAALSLAGPVGAVVGVTLGALGVNAYVSKAAQEAGKTRTRFVLDKLVIWGAQAGYTQEQLYTKIAQGISVAADGTIQLGRETAKIIEQFGNWLFTQEGEVVESVGGVGTPSYNVGDIEFLPVVAGGSYGVDFYYQRNHYNSVILPQGITSAYSLISSNGTLYVLSNTTSSGGFRFENTVNGAWAQVGSNVETWRTADNQFVIYTYTLSNVTNSTLPVSSYTGSQIDSVIRYTNGTFEDTTTAHDEVFTGTPDAWADNKDVLNPSAEDTPVVLNPDLLNPIIDSLADGQQATMSIIDYLQALQDAWDHALDDVQTAIGKITDTLTGIQDTIAIPDEAVKNPTVADPSVTPDTTPILDPSTVDPGTAVTGLSFDLTQIFPFCIPFDIYAMLATLSATPEAPVYHVHYEGPYNIVIDFTVDLSPWNSVASVLRTVELLAFCIGLAYVTRSMFIRS